MSRTGRFTALLLAALGVFAAVYLLFGEDLDDGTGAGNLVDPRRAEGAGGDLSAPGLEASGRRPPTAAELAAEEAARADEARARLRTEGVYGTVLDGKGRPIAGATVHLLPYPPEDQGRQEVPDRPPLATAISAEDGSFVVGPMPEDTLVKLRGEAAGYAPTVRRVEHRGARVDLILDRGGALLVRVIDAAAKPVAGASVLHRAASVVTTQSTSAAGLARFPALPTGTGSLVVTKEGHGAVRDANVAVAPGATEERTVVLPRPLEIVGTVVRASDKLPLAGVEVGVRYPRLHALEPGAPVKTGEDGRFRLYADVGGQEQVVIRARKAGFAEARSWRGASAKGEVSIEMREAGEALVGRVTTADRQPAAGARVVYTNMEAEDKSEVPEARTNRDGEFTLPLPAWANTGWNLTVVALSDADGVGAATYRVPKKEAGRPTPLKIELGGTGTLEGLVSDGAGRPVQGALVHLAPDWSVMRGRSSRLPASWQVLQVISQGRYFNLSAVSGADGRYAVLVVPALSYKLTASYGLDQVTLADPVTVVAGEVAEVDVSLGEGGTIEGWVVDSEQKPVPGAFVSARPAQRNRMGWWQNRPSARAQSDGRFVLRGVSDDRYHVSASASGYGGAQQQNVSAGDKEVTLRLRALGWIVGVVYEQGKPYSGTFTVQARPLQSNVSSRRVPFPGGSFNSWVPGQQRRTFNTDDGRFEIRGLAAGDYALQADTPAGQIAVQSEVVAVVDGRASREARLDLKTGAVLRGVVRDHETGKPIPNAWVYANARAAQDGAAVGATSGNAQTDVKGKYEIRGLAGGPYTVSVWTREGGSFSTVTDVAEGLEQALDLVRRPPGAIEFTVVDEKGQPVEGARPQIQSAHGSYVSVNVQAMRKDGLIGDSFDWRALWNTDGAGVLVRYHVPPGSMTVWASKEGHVLVGEKQVVEVRSGRTTRVQVTLKRKDGG